MPDLEQAGLVGSGVTTGETPPKLIPAHVFQPTDLRTTRKMPGSGPRQPGSGSPGPVFRVRACRSTRLPAGLLVRVGYVSRVAASADASCARMVRST